MFRLNVEDLEGRALMSANVVTALSAPVGTSAVVRYTGPGDTNMYLGALRDTMPAEHAPQLNFMFETVFTTKLA